MKTPEKVHHLNVAEIIASSTNRETFLPEELEEMKDSILEKGVIQPIIVRPVSAIENEEVRAAAIKAGAKYELIAGERRWRGSKLAGKETIPALVREHNDFDALAIQAIENAQRVNPLPLEEGQQYEKLLQMGKCSIDELAARIGKNRPYIYGRISLTRLPDKAKEASERILKGDWHGRPLSAAEAQRFIFEQCMMQLKNAPFDPKDKTLVKDAGPCAS